MPPQAIWVLPTPVVGEGQTWEVALTTQSWGQVVLFSPFSHRKLPQTPEDVVFWTLLTMTDEVPELVFRAVCTSWMETDLSPYDVGARTCVRGCRRGGAVRGPAQGACRRGLLGGLLPMAHAAVVETTQRSRDPVPSHRHMTCSASHREGDDDIGRLPRGRLQEAADALRGLRGDGRDLAALGPVQAQALPADGLQEELQA